MNLRQNTRQKAPLPTFTEGQVERISILVRLGILVWSGAILTVSYVELPEFFKIPKQKLDPTFIASVFTSVAASFGVQTSRKETKNLSEEEVRSLIKQTKQSPPIESSRSNQRPLDPDQF